MTIKLPLSFREPNLEDLQSFFDIMNTVKNKKVDEII